MPVFRRGTDGAVRGGRHGKGNCPDRAFPQAFFLCLLGVLFLVLPAGAAVFDFSPATPRVNQGVTFSVSNPLWYNLIWNFGDGSTATGNGITHTYAYPGTYTVTLQYTQSGIDTFTKTTARTVTVSRGSYIIISPIGDKCVRDKFTITAQTDLAVGDEVLIQVYSSSFVPTGKSQSGEFSGATGTAKVASGSMGINTISFDVDASAFKPDEYQVTATAVTSDVTGSARFHVTDCPTPVTTVKTTTMPTPQGTVLPTPPTGDGPGIFFPWILLLVFPLGGYVLIKEHGKAVTRAEAKKNCPKMPASVSFDGGVGMEEDPPGCLNINVGFSGGAEDNEAGTMR
jgi:hypothetical protein